MITTCFSSYIKVSHVYLSSAHKSFVNTAQQIIGIICLINSIERETLLVRVTKQIESLYAKLYML